MEKVNKSYDSQIKKMADQTTKARKQGGDQVAKTMESSLSEKGKATKFQKRL